MTVDGMPIVAADTAAGDSLAAVADELIGPLSTAATPEDLPWSGEADVARVDVGPSRFPMVLVALVADLDGGSLAVTPTTGDAQQSPLQFGPYTQAGSALLGYVPAVDGGGAAAPFSVTFAATARDTTGAAVALSADEIRAAVRIQLVQGMLGRLLHVLTHEKVALRRQARHISAARRLAAASGNALDRIGADLRCPRFADELVWDAARGTPDTQPLSPPGTLEDDRSYRMRLTLLRTVRLPTPAWVRSALDDASGTIPIDVDESQNQLLLAFRLIAPGAPDARAELLDAIRLVHLVWPAGSPAGDAAHTERMLPPPVTQHVDDARAALAGWHLPADQPVAPTLAGCLQSLADRCARLGSRPWPSVLRGQSDDGGSRYELGLGALLAPPDPAALDAAVAAATALNDPDLVARARDDDPAGAWLLTACGLRTATQDADGSVFVSAAPMGPLVVDVTPAPDAAVPLTLTATLPSASDPAHDAPMADVVAALTAAGVPAAETPGDVLNALQPGTSQPEVSATLAAAGLPVVESVTDFNRLLSAVAARDYAVFDLGPDRTAALRSGDATALETVLATAASAGASSAVAAITAAGDAALVLAVVGLPLGGSNLAAQHTVFHRWEVRALAGTPVDLDSRRGPEVQVRWPGKGISVVSCVVHVRSGGNDPYEWRPSLPSGALLSLPEYEYLMNAVALLTPIGVRANTWTVRQHHVDVDGSGAARPLPPSAARVYRQFRTGG